MYMFDLHRLVRSNTAAAHLLPSELQKLPRGDVLLAVTDTNCEENTQRKRKTHILPLQIVAGEQGSAQFDLGVAVAVRQLTRAGLHILLEVCHGAQRRLHHAGAQDLRATQNLECKSKHIGTTA
jgi:hypothetical protein